MAYAYGKFNTQYTRTFEKEKNNDESIVVIKLPLINLEGEGIIYDDCRTF